jgi:hypothetical protein
VIPNLTPFAGWVWPCVQCGGCQTPAVDPVSVDVAYGIDFPPDSDAPDDGGNTVFPLSTVDNDIDLSAVPNNSAAVIRMSIIWFQYTGETIVQAFYEMVLLAWRDDNGDLHSDLTWIHANIVTTGDTAFDVTAVSIPDNDTIRWQLSNLKDESAIVFFRTLISTVQAGNPLPPPPA